MADDLMSRIRLGEDSVFEFKSVRTERGRILAPDRRDLGDELAALTHKEANANDHIDSSRT